MADRTDFHFRQRVTEAELDLAFALLEKADRDLTADLNNCDIVSGAVPAQHSPVPDLTVDLTAPARAYDNPGQRMFFGTGQTVNCTVDLVGIPTDVATVGNERWLGIFLRFERLLSDPRTDGNSRQRQRDCSRCKWSNGRVPVRIVSFERPKTHQVGRAGGVREAEDAPSWTREGVREAEDAPSWTRKGVREAEDAPSWTCKGHVACRTRGGGGTRRRRTWWTRCCWSERCGSRS